MNMNRTKSKMMEGQSTTWSSVSSHGLVTGKNKQPQSFYMRAGTNMYKGKTNVFCI